jgi:hypothetical protein
MFENQMKKKRAARNGNHLAAMPGSRLPPVMLLRVKS